MKKLFLIVVMFLVASVLFACSEESDNGVEPETVFLEVFNIEFERGGTLPSPALEGYEFKGWTIDQEGSIIIENLDDFPDVDRLYPKFVKIETDNPNEENNLNIADMLERNSRSMVGVRSFEEKYEEEGLLFYDGLSLGSGVIYKIDGTTHYVITNNHVINDQPNQEIFFERKGNIFEVEEVTVVGSYEKSDIALITFEWDNEEDFSSVYFADSSQIRRGETVVAVGTPLGIEYFGTATSGIISHPSRFIDDQEKNLTAFFIQHDAAISPGNSGGALFDVEGNLLGLNTLKIVSDAVEGMGFSIPSNTMVRVLRDLEELGYVEEPFLGISSSVYTVTCEGAEFGVCVAEVVPNGSAEAIGIEEGDLIIGFKNLETEIEFEINNFFNLREAILQSRVGDEVIVKIVRDGEAFWTEPQALGNRDDFEE